MSHQGRHGQSHEDHGAHKGHKKGHIEHGNHHAHMVADFKQCFWISLAFTVPILLLSPMIQTFLGFEQALGFTSDVYVLWALSSAVFLYGGWPFLKGIYEELEKNSPA